MCSSGFYDRLTPYLSLLFRENPRTTMANTPADPTRGVGVCRLAYPATDWGL
jgi:hypothetical protein